MTFSKSYSTMEKNNTQVDQSLFILLSPTARAHEYIALYALADLLKTYGVSWNSYSPCFF